MLVVILVAQCGVVDGCGARRECDAAREVELARIFTYANRVHVGWVRLWASVFH